MPKRLAITISGAVSLGSYEAGVLYELLTALRQHNQNPNTLDCEKIFIDVLTGASAGAMTAAICAQKMLFEDDSFLGHRNNPLYLPWVTDISLQGLLAMSPTDDPTESILSSDLIETISKRYLTQRYQTGLEAPKRTHPASAELLYLGLALSNLNGIDYGVEMFSGGSFVYTKHQDQLIRELTLGGHDNLAVWEPIRQTAVACGAFPFAFRVKELIRLRSEYESDDSKPINYPATNGAYAYTDGGVFQNEPLGLAKNLVDKIDDHQNYDSRFYLFVAPGAKESKIDNTFRAADAKFLPTALRLATSVFEQARFQDWVMAESINDQIKLFNGRADALKTLFETNAIDVDSVVKVNQALIPSFYKAAAAADSDRSRLKQQFEAEYSKLASVGQKIADAWIDSILLFERAADLPDKDEMQIFGITASGDELAGDDLVSFSGFFDQRLRDNDYDVGRKKTRDFINGINGNPKSPLYPIRYAPSDNEPIDRIDASLGRSGVADLPQALRIKLRDQIKNRLWETMTEMGLNDVVKFGIQEFFIDKKLNQWLALG